MVFGVSKAWSMVPVNALDVTMLFGYLKFSYLDSSHAVTGGKNGLLYLPVQDVKCTPNGHILLSKISKFTFSLQLNFLTGIQTLPAPTILSLFYHVINPAKLCSSQNTGIKIFILALHFHHSVLHLPVLFLMSCASGGVLHSCFGLFPISLFSASPGATF